MLVDVGARVIELKKTEIKIKHLRQQLIPEKKPQGNPRECQRE